MVSFQIAPDCGGIVSDGWGLSRTAPTLPESSTAPTLLAESLTPHLARRTTGRARGEDRRARGGVARLVRGGRRLRRALRRAAQALRRARRQALGRRAHQGGAARQGARAGLVSPPLLLSRRTVTRRGFRAPLLTRRRVVLSPSRPPGERGLGHRRRRRQGRRGAPPRRRQARGEGQGGRRRRVRGVCRQRQRLSALSSLPSALPLVCSSLGVGAARGVSRVAPSRRRRAKRGGGRRRASWRVRARCGREGRAVSEGTCVVVESRRRAVARGLAGYHARRLRTAAQPCARGEMRTDEQPLYRRVLRATRERARKGGAQAAFRGARFFFAASLIKQICHRT